MDNYQMVVGTEDCPLKTVVSILRKSTAIQEEWSTFARLLYVPSDHISMLRRDFLLNKLEYEDLIFEVLEFWIGKNGSKATLVNLLQVIEDDCGANDVGELLRLKYKLPCKKEPKMESENKPHVLIKGLPEQLSYYVNRTIITRNIISDKIFDQNTSDIFLFTGMDRWELSKMAKDRPAGNSREQLQNRLNVKFMILDHENDFERICRKTNNNNPVHVVGREGDGKLRWIKSKGEMNNLRSYIDQKQDELDEGEFCKISTSKSVPVLICDTPGMGKSALLAQIGHRLAQMYPKKTVLFIVLREFINLAKSLEIEDKVQMIDLTLQEWTEDALPQSKVNCDEEAILIELLLDGYDEVDSVDRKLALEILQTISKSFKGIRLWITSRPHLMKELENSLKVLGYYIRPFHEKNQVHFLSSFWSQKVLLDQGKVELYAKQCLRSLGATMNATDNDIAGIPLQCLLIGEVYKDDAVKYAKASNGNMTRASLKIEIGTITNLYRKLVEVKFQKYKSTFANAKFAEDDFMTIHSQLSLELLFPVKQGISKLRKNADELDIDEEMKGGILTSTPAGAVTFIHKTFAEYFVAWFLVDKLQREEEWTPELVSLLFKIMRCSKLPRLKTPKQTELLHLVICYFLNSMLANIRIEILPCKFPFKLNDKQVRLVKNIAIACIEGNFVQIFKLFDTRGTFDKLTGKAYNKPFVDIFKLFVPRDQFTNLSDNFFNLNLLLRAVRNSNVEIVKSVLAHFERSNTFDSGVQKATVREAVKNGKFSILEFLIKEKSLRGVVEDWDENTNLVSDCVVETVGLSHVEINERILTLQMLVAIKGSLVDGLNGSGEMAPVFCKQAHGKLLIELVRLGANVLVQNKESNTVLHLHYPTTTFYMCREDYHKLVMSISKENLKKLVHLEGAFRDTVLTSILRWFDPLPETLRAFHGVGVDFHHVNGEGDPVLAVAIKNGRNAETIRKLIQLGADVNEVDKQGNTPLHVVAESDKGSRQSIIQHLLERGSNPRALNNRNVTPFHSFLTNNKGNGWKIFLLFKTIWDGRSLWTPTIATLALVYAVSGNDDDFPDQNFEGFARECESHGADFNWREDDGNSLLLRLAANNGKVIKFLIGNGANSTEITDHSENILHFAALGTVDALKYFLELGGVDVNGKDLWGDTPLHCVVDYRNKSGELDCLVKCRLLIQYGADVSILNCEGHTPQEISKMRQDKNEQLNKLLH